MEYFLHILILVAIYVILATSLNLIAGYAGMLSIAHAALYGMGAYVAALMALKLHSPFLVNLLFAVLLTGGLGLLLGIPALRVRDDYFVVVTFGFQIIMFNVLNNWISFTGGPMGLAGVPQPSIFGWSISSRIDFLILGFCLGCLSIVICWRLGRSPFGRVLKALREDEVFAMAAGKNVAASKLVVFLTAASLAATAGVMYAYYVSFIDPTSFGFTESVLIISIVIVGGAGNLWGSVLGAVLLISLPELLRFVGLPGVFAANVRQILYGALLILFVMWRPQGLLGEYRFQKAEAKE